MMILLAALVVLVVALTFRAIALDGYGTRPPPPSHHDPFPTVPQLRRD